MTFGRTFGDGLPVQSLPDSCEGRQPVDVEAAPGGLKAGSRVGHVRREELEAGGLF